MSRNRLEAFSDGVIAILITIMVLELRVPHGSDWGALRDVLPVLGTYVLSFVFIGIYWNNHHHMMTLVQRVNGATLWANLHLLFWLSLVPFVTSWMGNNNFDPIPTAVYGVVLFMAGISFLILELVIVALQGEQSALRQALGKDIKGRMSGVLYAAAIPLAFLSQWISVAVYVGVACLWLVPDRRIENHVIEKGGSPE